MAKTRAEALAAVAARYPDTTPKGPRPPSMLPPFTPEQLASFLAPAGGPEPGPVLYGHVSDVPSARPDVPSARPDLPSAPAQLALFPISQPSNVSTFQRSNEVSHADTD